MIKQTKLKVYHLDTGITEELTAKQYIKKYGVI